MSNQMTPEQQEMFIANGGEQMSPEEQKKLMAQIAKQTTGVPLNSPGPGWASRTLEQARKNKTSQERLKLAENAFFFDEVWPADAIVPYSQQFYANTKLKAATLLTVRDPRDFVANDHQRLSKYMRAFFIKGIGKDGSPIEQFLSLAMQAPAREPSDISYIHQAMSNQAWSVEQRRTVIRGMMEFKFNPNREWNSEFPIERAVRMGDSQIVSSLLQAGADLTVMDNRGYNALNLAVEHGHAHLIPQLVRFGARPQNTASGDSPLMLAIINFDRDCKKDPTTAFRNLYTMAGALRQVNCISNSTDNAVIPTNSVAYRALEKIREANAPHFDGMMEALHRSLSKIEALAPGKIKAMQAMAPKNMKAFTNMGGLQSSPNSTFRPSIKWLSGHLDVKLGNKLSSSVMDLAFQTKNNDQFESLKRGSTHQGKNLLDVVVPQHRDLLNLDQQSTSPPHDTILHHAARYGISSMLDFCMREHCNLHVINGDGNYPIHLIAQLDDLRTMKLMLSKLVGLPSKDGRRESLYEDAKYADLRALNANGQSFLDVLAQKNPDWVTDIAEHLGISDQLDGLYQGELAGLAPLDDLKHTASPPRALSNDIPGYKHLRDYGPNDPVPPVRFQSNTSTQEEDAAFTKNKEDDVLQIISMLQMKSNTPEREQYLREQLSTHLQATPVETKLSIIFNAVQGMFDTKEDSSAINKLRRDVASRVGKELNESLKDPDVCARALKAIEAASPGKDKIQILASLRVLGLDIEPADKIYEQIMEASTARFANDIEKFQKNNPSDTNGSPKPPGK